MKTLLLGYVNSQPHLRQNLPLTACLLSLHETLSMPGPTPLWIRNQIIGMSRAGATNIAIAVACRVNVRTVQRVTKLNRIQGNVIPKKSSGGPRKTTVREDRRLIRLTRRHRRLSSLTLAQRWRPS